MGFFCGLSTGFYLHFWWMVCSFLFTSLSRMVFAAISLSSFDLECMWKYLLLQLEWPSNVQNHRSKNLRFNSSFTLTGGFRTDEQDKCFTTFVASFFVMPDSYWRPSLSCKCDWNAVTNLLYHDWLLLLSPSLLAALVCACVSEYPATWGSGSNFCRILDLMLRKLVSITARCHHFEP